MARPKMIIFDAGRTLLDYASIDTLKGVKTFMPYITSNPLHLTAEEIDQRTNEVFALFETSRKQLFEVPECTVLALVYDLLKLEFSVSIKEVEKMIWDADAVKVPTPNAKEALEALDRMGIQTAVISNLDFSGDLLRMTLNELFPDNQFQFVIASSDYGIRKPNPWIFDAGIMKSGFEARDIWYVGDKISVDVVGSQSAGMTPVLFKCPRNCYEEIPAGLRVMNDFMDLVTLVNLESGYEADMRTE